MWLSVTVTTFISPVGDNMRNDRRLILVLVLLMAALVVSACSSDNQSGSGVARLEDTQPAEPVIVSAGPSNPQADTPVPLVSETNATEQADPNKPTRRFSPSLQRA